MGRMIEFPIVTKLGGRKAVFGRLKARGVISTERAIGMWSADSRGRIPGDAARELMAWADEMAIPYSADDFRPSSDVPSQDTGQPNGGAG